MEIFFCSHCQQSIPLKDIQSGVAELRRGKYLCVTCREIVTPVREKKPNYAAMYLGIFLALCHKAANNGLESFDAFIHQANHRVMRLIKSCGLDFESKYNDGMKEVRIWL